MKLRSTASTLAPSRPDFLNSLSHNQTLDRSLGPCANGARRSSTPSATIKARMGAVHFLMKTLPRVSGEMALHVLAYNLTRVMNIVGSRLLIAAIRA